jgi:hypothetical protein
MLSPEFAQRQMMQKTEKKISCKTKRSALFCTGLFKFLSRSENSFYYEDGVEGGLVRTQLIWW